MEFEEWSNRQKERQGFEAWGASRPPSVTDEGRRASSSDLGSWTERSEGTKYLSRNREEKRNTAKPVMTNYNAPFYGAGDAARSGVERTQSAQPTKPQPVKPQPTQPERTPTPASRRGRITLHPGIEEVDHKAKESAAVKEKSPEKAPPKQAKAPFTPVGQSVRTGETNAPESFTFSQSPKAETPANRVSAFDATLLPGWQAKTGMVPIPKSVEKSACGDAPWSVY